MQTASPMRYLEPEMLRALSSMELRARLLVEGLYASRHRCPFYGYSVEFKDFRDYVAGDDPRLIDTRMLARTERYYVRRFEMESNMNVTVLLDASGSMGYQSRFDRRRLSKMEYARYLAAGMAYLVQKQQDAPGLVTFDASLRDYLPPRQGRRHLFGILATLEGLEPRDGTSVGDALDTVALRLPRRGMVVLLSDCYGDTEAILGGVANLRVRGHEVVVFHLLDADETTFPFETLSNFRDLETGSEVMCDPFRQRQRYLDAVTGLRERIAAGCATTGADYVYVDTRQPIETVLRDYLLYRRRRA